MSEYSDTAPLPKEINQENYMNSYVSLGGHLFHLQIMTYLCHNDHKGQTTEYFL